MCRRIEKNAGGRLREVIYIVGGTTGHEYNMDVWKLQRPANAPQTEVWGLTRLNVCSIIQLLTNIFKKFSDEFRMNLGVIALNWSLMSKCCFRLAVQFQVDLNNLILYFILSLFIRPILHPA